jgi:hypothetical protein
MIIPGATAFAEPMQGSIAHIILMNFARKMEEFRTRDSEPLTILTLRNEIQLFHNQMKYPWGQLLMLEKNAKTNIEINQYYALKSLTTVVKIIDRENFVKLLRTTDQEFEALWGAALKEAKKLIKEISRFEILENVEITASTLSLYNKIKREKDYVHKNLIKIVDKIKFAWQFIWDQFKLTRKAFDFVLSDLNDDFDIKLSKIKPFIQDESLLVVAVNKYSDIRLWGRGKAGIFKAVPAERLLKWKSVDQIDTEMRTDWWLSAIKKIDADYKANSYANMTKTNTDTTVY